jgi:DNA repair protein RadC
VVDYLSHEIGHASVETVHVLFMDSGNRLIDEMVETGDIDSVHVDIRMIVQRALIVGAAGIILAHNHPSGDNHASKADREVTRALARAVSGLGIVLFDHLVISGREARSLRAEGVL